jgi:hypothetical protein
MKNGKAMQWPDAESAAKKLFRGPFDRNFVMTTAGELITVAAIANKRSRKRRIDGKLGLMVEARRSNGNKLVKLWPGSFRGYRHGYIGGFDGRAAFYFCQYYNF